MNDADRAYIKSLRDRGFEDLALQHERFCEGRDKIEALKAQPQPQVEQPTQAEETQQEPEPDEGLEILRAYQLDNEKQKARILDKLEKEVDVDDEDFSQIPFENLPKEKQAEVQKTVDAINAQIEKHVAETNAKIAKFNDDKMKEVEAKVDKMLSDTFKFYSDPKIQDIINKFIEVLVAMNEDPANNLCWTIKLFNERADKPYSHKISVFYSKDK